MASLGIRYDFRCPEICPVGVADLYQTALEQCEWAERNGFANVVLSEHHGSDDGYLPSLVSLASAIAARTERMRIALAAVIAPMHDPIRLAEDLAVLDNLSRGRLDVIIAAGYVPSEFEMFDRQPSDRVRLVKEAFSTLKDAWTGEPFEFRGRTVQVTPRPYQRPRPPLILGGGVDAAARRAAHIADWFFPMTGDPWPAYRDEMVKLGKPDPGPMPARTGLYFHVTDDPDGVWEQVAPHALHEMNAYGRWAAESGAATGYQPVEDASVLRDLGYQIVTPDEAVEMIDAMGPTGAVTFHPLMGGLDPELSWQNLRTFEEKVLPRLG